MERRLGAPHQPLRLLLLTTQHFRMWRANCIESAPCYAGSDVSSDLDVRLVNSIVNEPIAKSWCAPQNCSPRSTCMRSLASSDRSHNTSYDVSQTRRCGSNFLLLSLLLCRENCVATIVVGGSMHLVASPEKNARLLAHLRVGYRLPCIHSHGNMIKYSSVARLVTLTPQYVGPVSALPFFFLLDSITTVLFAVIQRWRYLRTNIRYNCPSISRTFCRR